MNTALVWVLSIIAAGNYSMVPVRVHLTFPTQSTCEAARATVDVNRMPVWTKCESEKAKP